MTTTIVNEFNKFFSNLTATSPVCVALDTILTVASNLFMYVEPTDATQIITIIPYGGSPPLLKNRQESNVQIRVKAKSYRKAMETSQAVINTLHENDSVCASSPGKVFANQSCPIFLTALEGGEWPITVSNYTIKHVKF